MQLNEICKQAYENSVAKGFGTPDMVTDKEKYPDQALKVHMLMVSEIAEACESVRDREPAFWAGIPGHDYRFEPHTENMEIFFTAVAGQVGSFKPEGEATELADCVIRICDWFGRHGWDLEAVIKAKMDYNATRSFKHGNKAA